MTTFVALLRGINLGKAKRVAMPQLRAIASGLGYGEVRTYINSGNLVFTSSDSAEAVRSALEQAILSTVGLPVDVVVRTAEELAAVLAANPFPEGDPSRVVVAFLAGPPAAGAEAKVAELAAEHEPFSFSPLEVYVDFSQGQAGSELAAKLTGLLGGPATVRNLNTVRKLVALSAG